MHAIAPRLPCKLNFDLKAGLLQLRTSLHIKSIHINDPFVSLGQGSSKPHRLVNNLEAHSRVPLGGVSEYDKQN